MVQREVSYKDTVLEMRENNTSDRVPVAMLATVLCLGYASFAWAIASSAAMDGTNHVGHAAT